MWVLRIDTNLIEDGQPSAGFSKVSCNASAEKPVITRFTQGVFPDYQAEAGSTVQQFLEKCPFDLGN
ncbi:hypothetical protein GCM10027180_10560 [Microbulbifer echini]